MARSRKASIFRRKFGQHVLFWLNGGDIRWESDRKCGEEFEGIGGLE